MMGEKDQAAYCREVRSYEFALIKSQKAQGQSGDSAAGRSDTFTHAFLDAVCGLRSPALYEATADLPGLVLLAFYLGTVPSPMLLLAPFVLLWMIARECASSKLLAHAPFSPVGTWLHLGVFGALLALVCSFLPMLPATVVATVTNGVGDVAYPVIYWQADVLVRSTVGKELLLYAVFFLIAGFCLGSLCSLATSLRSPSVMIAGVFLMVPPLLDNSYSLGALAPDVFSVLPSTYFSAGRIFGRLGGTGATNAIPIAGASASLGAASISVTALLMGLAGAIVRAATLSHSFGKGRRGSVDGDITGGFLLQARDAQVGYVRNHPIVSGDLNLDPKSVVGFVAPNGYGKTTFLTALAGMPRKPSATSASLEARSETQQVGPTHQAAWRQLAFLLPGDSAILYDHLMPDQMVELVRCLWGRRGDVRDYLADMGAAEFRHKRIGTLSQGMRQQVSIAVALATQASVLLMDEPMNALDPTNRQLASERIRAYASEGHCVFMSSHLLHDLDETCDDSYFIQDGKLVDVGGRHRPPLPDLYWRFYPRS
jgi:ABC-type multidrug transport system ATPase subunit